MDSVRVTEQAGTQAAAPTLLLVDDDPEMVRSLRTLLAIEFSDVRTVATTSPEEALRVLSNEPVDVLVADYRMPVLNGLTLILRAHQIQPDLPAFLITGYPHETIATVATEKGHVEAYLTKPLDLARFHQDLDRILRGRRPRWPRARTAAGLNTPSSARIPWAGDPQERAAGTGPLESPGTRHRSRRT